MYTSLQYPIEKVGLPMIITSGKPNLCFLIDTGATHNIVFSYVYEGLPKYFTLTQETSSLMGIDGNANKVIQVEATFAFEDKEITSNFSVLDANRAVIQVQKEHGIQIHGILGIPFLIQNRWILDFQNLQVIMPTKDYSDLSKI